MSTALARKEEYNKKMTEQYLAKTIKSMKQQVGLYRKYREGELPDIQIHYQDVLLPLSALVKRDPTIATEVFVELFSEIYKSLNVEEERQSLGAGVKRVLNDSNRFDYGCINCMHRVAMELLKVDGFTVQASAIMRTGQHSMSFQTALMLLEETIIHGAELHKLDYEAALQPQLKRRRGEQKAGAASAYNFVFSGISDANRKYWFNMISLYEIIANEDALQGIWSFIAEDQGVVDAQDNAVNLIKQAHMLKTKGSIGEGLRVLEQALADDQRTGALDEHVRTELQNKRY